MVSPDVLRGDAASTDGLRQLVASLVGQQLGVKIEVQAKPDDRREQYPGHHHVVDGSRPVEQQVEHIHHKHCQQQAETPAHGRKAKVIQRNNPHQQTDRDDFLHDADAAQEALRLRFGEHCRHEYRQEGEHDIQVVPGATHTSIDYNPTTPWLKTHTRNPYPKYVYWENFNMDGRYRDGFYNLYVKERSDENGARACYEMTIEGNTINLKVSNMTAEVTERTSQWNLAKTYSKSFTPATKGRVVIFLNDQLVELDQPVIVNVNGKEVYNDIVELDAQNLVNSCAIFFDPARLYPAAIEVEIK